VDERAHDVAMTLDGVPAAARQAREFVRLWLAVSMTGIPEEKVHDAVLVASELVSNALHHRPPTITVRLAGRARGCRIEVADAGLSAFSPPADPLDAVAEQRIHLAVVAALGVLGQVLDARGTTVWAELTW
jgi:anti-sigma regulatory factor (Ser/Thr protein kinase)